MTMTDREKLAREWAEEYQNDWPRFTPGTHAAELVEKAKAAADYILATTTPQTMADVVWDDEEHHLAGATTPSGHEVVMMWYDDRDDHIVTNQSANKRYWLTPNGKRYELREVTEPDHPEVLETEEDYENAPAGTIVVCGDDYPYTKSRVGKWLLSVESKPANDKEMAARLPFRRVLRWGWGGEA